MHLLIAHKLQIQTRNPLISDYLIAFIFPKLHKLICWLPLSFIGYRKKQLRCFGIHPSRFKRTNSRPNTYNSRNTLDIGSRPPLAVTEHLATASGDIYTVSVKDNTVIETHTSTPSSSGFHNSKMNNYAKVEEGPRLSEKQGKSNNELQYSYAECRIHVGPFARKTASVSVRSHEDDNDIMEDMIPNDLYRASMLNAGSSWF